jgi:hypothetical protein
VAEDFEVVGKLGYGKFITRSVLWRFFKIKYLIGS